MISKWVGDSERNIRQLFERARENRPSIVFIDEIDAIAGRRGESLGVHDSHVNQLLAEIDGLSGQRGVFVVGATNRPDQLDSALLAGWAVVADDLPRSARWQGQTGDAAASHRSDADPRRPLRGACGGDRGLLARRLEVLAQEAALAAISRTGDQEQSPSVLHEDFVEAVSRLQAGKTRPGVPQPA